MERNTLWKLAAGAGAALLAREALRRARAYDLAGKTVLITGGSRGLGLVLARMLAQEGARIALCARDEGELERARAELALGGADVFVVPCDLTDRGQVRDMVLSVLERFGAIHVLINNAGVVQVGPMEVMTVEDYEEAMQIHFYAPLYAALEVLPDMRRRREGRIVNIASIGGKISVPHLLPYSASKFALVGLSEGMRTELKKDGIVVTTVCPGLMRTGSHVNAYVKGQHRTEFALFSLMDAAPGLSVRAEGAARRIVSALRHGDAEVVIGLPWQVAAVFHGLFPGATADLLSLTNRALPGPGGIGTERVKGRDSRPAFLPGWFTASIDRAAEQNNEM